MLNATFLQIIGAISALFMFTGLLAAEDHERQNRRNLRKATVLDMLLKRPTQGPDDWTRPHPEHQARLAGAQDRLRRAPSCETIAFGDSLLDLARLRLRAVPTDLNFAINGSAPYPVIMMARDIQTLLKTAGRYQDVRYVIVGSLGANPLLAHYPLDQTIRHSLAALDTIRTLYPSARIIVYGIPPTVDHYTNTNAIPFELELLRWVSRDRDARLLPFQRHFAGRFGLMPRADMTHDGVHFSSKGIAVFDELLMKAKTATGGIIVD